MSAIDRLREIHPYQRLLMAVLIAVMIAQGVAMAMVAQGQVERAQAFYADRSQTEMAAAAVKQASRQASHGDSIAVATLQPAAAH